MRRLSWSLVLVSFAARAQTPAGPPPPPPPEPDAPPVVAPAAPTRPAEPTSWTLRVHLLSADERVELRRTAGDLVRVVECKAPCDAEVRFTADETFTLGGPALAESNPFTFRPRNGDVTLRVEPRASSSRTGGVVLAVFGGITLAAGLGVTGLASVTCLALRGAGDDCHGLGGYMLLGGLVAAVGAGLAYAGGNIASQGTEFTVEE
jgi:hypothetical protein